MQRMFYLLGGILLAILSGVLYLKFSAPMVVTAPTAPPPVTPDELHRAVDMKLLFTAVFAWVLVFLPLPRWLSALLGLGIALLGFAMTVVSALFVFMAYPHNTLQDGPYVDFLCGLAMITAGLVIAMKCRRDPGAQGPSEP